MKLRSIAFLLFLGLLAVQAAAETTYAQANPFACKAHGGGSFILDESDFQAMSASGITREQFAALAPSTDHTGATDIRFLLRHLRFSHGGIFLYSS